MSNWIRFNRGNCPVCQGLRKDCRQNTETNLIHCRSSQANPPDYVFRGEDAWGFGMWAYAPDAEAWTEERREEWRREQEAKKQIRERIEQERNERSLSAIERDREIKKIISQLPLRYRHRQQLRARGLTDEQIELGGYRSVSKWQKLDTPVNDELAGVKARGRSLVNPDSGILCPIPNEEGQLVSWQLRQENNTKSKYIWAASERKRKNRHTSKTKEFGELPLGVWQQPNNKGSNTGIVGLTEGTGIKPYIASCRLDIPAIGASGGNFASSSKTLEAALRKLQPTAIILYPDAGAVCNPNVVRQYQKLFDLLQEWGYETQVAWWGQIEISDGDIDEIDSTTLSKIDYLSPEEFFELAKKKQYIQQQWDKRRDYKKFTSQIKIKKKYVEFGLPQSNTIAFIKSGLGTGKTTQITKHLPQIQEYGIIGLGYRNTLLLQFNNDEEVKNIGFYHLQSDKNLEEFSLDDPELKVSNCVDSLIYYDQEQFDGKIIIIDEIISVLKHLLFSSTIKQFAKVKELFTEMVKRCDRLICLDGFMQDWAVTFFKELCPTKQIVTIENTFKGDKARVYLLEGTIDIDEKIRVNDKTPWLEKLLNSDCPAIASDSQIFCEAIENLLLEQGRVGIRVDSKTVSEDRVKEFFSNPDKWIEENPLEYLIYSPSAESGLDVSIENYFSDHFAFLFGQLDIDSCIQMLGRIRDISVPKYVWCKKFITFEDTNRRSSNVESIQAERARSLMAELHSTLNGTESPEAKISYLQQVYQNNLDPYTTIADTITAIRNHEFANYRECLKRQLIDSGYPVESVTLEKLDNAKAIAEQEREAKTDVKEQNAYDFYNASNQYIGQTKANLSFDADWKTRCAMLKAQLVNRLPGIDRDSVWSPEFIKLVKYDKPNLIEQTRLYHLLDNLELAKQLSLEKYNGIFNQGSIAAPWKLRQDYLKVKALRDIGLYDFVRTAIANPDFTYTADSKEVKAIVAYCRQKKHQSVLGTPGKDSIKFVNKLLRTIGIETKSKKVKQQGKTVSIYLLDRKHLLSKARLAILQAIRLKYRAKIDAKERPLEWVPEPQNYAVEAAASKTAVTIDSYAIEAVAVPPYIYINNSTICNPQNNHYSRTNSTMETNDPNQIQSLLDTPEAIADLADMLTQIEDAEALAELQKVPEFTRLRLNRACRLLPLKQQRLIRQWALKNQQQKLTA